MNYGGHFEDKDGNKYFTGIVKSGSNDNGNYVKFSDGTMICTYVYDLTSDNDFSVQYGNIYYPASGAKNWIFPKPFTELHSVNGSAQLSGGIGGVGFNSNTISTTTVQFYIYSMVKYNFGSKKVYAYLTAIGKWK